MNETDTQILQRFAITAKKMADSTSAGATTPELQKTYEKEEQQAASIVKGNQPTVQTNWNKFLASSLLGPSEKSALEAKLKGEPTVFLPKTFSEIKQSGAVAKGVVSNALSLRCMFLAAACGAAAGSGEIPFAIYIAGEIISSC